MDISKIRAPFNLELANQHFPFGNKANGTAIEYHLIPDTFKAEYPLMVLFEDGQVKRFTKEGKANRYIFGDTDEDLFMFTMLKEEWWCIYSNSIPTAHASETEARIQGNLYTELMFLVCVTINEFNKRIHYRIV